jgi:hypothetical protein
MKDDASLPSPSDCNVAAFWRAFAACSGQDRYLHGHDLAGSVTAAAAAGAGAAGAAAAGAT